mmetsp:Transcript_10007/g.41494  ORF Transcript_10007/g.41494 Transcript_10007/m.41494 type:complete len:320 (-) Transcript_10007:443-1402(-)
MSKSWPCCHRCCSCCGLHTPQPCGTCSAGAPSCSRSEVAGALGRFACNARASSEPPWRCLYRPHSEQSWWATPWRDFQRSESMRPQCSQPPPFAMQLSARWRKSTSRRHTLSTSGTAARLTLATGTGGARASRNQPREPPAPGGAAPGGAASLPLATPRRRFASPRVLAHPASAPSRAEPPAAPSPFAELLVPPCACLVDPATCRDTLFRGLPRGLLRPSPTSPLSVLGSLADDGSTTRGTAFALGSLAGGGTTTRGTAFTRRMSLLLKECVSVAPVPSIESNSMDHHVSFLSPPRGGFLSRARTTPMHSAVYHLAPNV